MICRREFIAGVGSVAAWSVAARAQQIIVPVIGILHTSTPTGGTRRLNVDPFRRGVAEIGFIEGRDFAVEYRWAEDRPERLPVLASELVRRQVAIIATMPNSPAALAAKEATRTIPIVFITGVDPVDAGIVSSYAHPGGNITGFTVLSTELAAKRLELLHELVPAISRIAFLFNPGNLNNESHEVRNAAHQIGISPVFLPVTQPHEIEIAFARLIEERVGGLLIAADPLFFNNESQVVALAARHAIPTMHVLPTAVVNGGLMSYAPDRIEVARQLGIYAGRILKGEKPADLPVQRATKIDFLLNLKTAKALGISVPQSILLRANEVFE
jgi:putative tryptophan/tyrosine transport system substrate-binding protein